MKNEKERKKTFNLPPAPRGLICFKIRITTIEIKMFSSWIFFNLSFLFKIISLLSLVSSSLKTGMKIRIKTLRRKMVNFNSLSKTPGTLRKDQMGRFWSKAIWGFSEKLMVKNITTQTGLIDGNLRKKLQKYLFKSFN